MLEALIFASTNPHYDELTTDCSLFMKIVSSEYLQNMLCTQMVCFCFDIQNNFGTQPILQMLRASEKDLPVLSTIYRPSKKLMQSK